MVKYLRNMILCRDKNSYNKHSLELRKMKIMKKGDNLLCQIGYTIILEFMVKTKI